MDLATVEDWSEEILPEGVGVKWKTMGQGEGEGEGEGKEKYACPQGLFVCKTRTPDGRGFSLVR